MNKLFLIGLLVEAVALSGCIGPGGACTADAKLCDDGSYVGRDGLLNCEFRACPELTFCDATSPCPAGKECFLFPNEEKAYCFEGDPCTKCADPECSVLESYPAQIRCGEPLECVGEGDTMPVYPGFECCAGLKAINPTTPALNCEPLIGASICSNCGNGTCEQWENYCNCPEDCNGNGCRTQNYECTIEDIPCCEGLVEVPLAMPDESGQCIAATCGSVCRPCGNGVCDASENVCNCPADCQKEEFCGTSTLGACSNDANCVTDGCSGQVCRSKSEEPVITTCEYSNCFNNEIYGLKCGCSEGKCKWEPASLEAQARTFCREENLEGIYVCGEYIKVTSSLLGGGSTFYSLKEDGSLSEPIVCHVVGPDSMSEECKQLLFESNCVETKIC